MTEGVYIVMEGRKGGFQILTDIVTHSAYVLNFVDSNNILVDSCTLSLSQEDCEPSSCRIGIIFVVASSLFLTTYILETLNYTT